MSGAQDLDGPMIGYRWWRVDDGRLRSRTAGVAWVPGVNAARCYGPRDCARSPGRDCDCGLYAAYAAPVDADGLVVDGVDAIGAVAAWGERQPDGGGFRAEHARVAALAYPPEATAEVIMRLATLAAAYDVNLVVLAELPAAAAKHGKLSRPAAGPRRGALAHLMRRASGPAADLAEPVPGWQERVVELTAAPRALTRDQIYLPVTAHGERTLCHVRVFSAADCPAVVIVGNLNGRTGKSVSNAAASLAADIATRLIPDGPFAFVENYPRALFRAGDPTVSAAERKFTPVTFDGQAPRFGIPLSQEQVEAIVGQPVTVFPAGYYTPENVELVKTKPHAQVAADGLAPSCPDHGRAYPLYCAQGVSACEARNAREQRHFRQRPRRLAHACLRDGNYEGRWHEEPGWGEPPGALSVNIAGHKSRLHPAAGHGEFAWGYDGSGSYEVARAILADWHGHEVAPALWEAFTEQVITGLATDEFALPFERVAAWLSKRYQSRGLVFIVSMAGARRFGGDVGCLIADELVKRGFEVYMDSYPLGDRPPARDPYASFASEVIASHRGALERASLIVVPYGLIDMAPPSVAAALALDYVEVTDDVAVAIVGLDEAVALDGPAWHFAVLGAAVTPPVAAGGPDGQRVAAAVCQLVEDSAQAAGR